MEEFADQIGGRLREAREAAGLSVEDVMFRTRIPRSVVNALEAGDFSTFSSPTYAKSFLSQYSDFLNVEAGPWLDALQPASFISGEIMRPQWEASDHHRREPVSVERTASGGWLSALLLFALSGSVVFAAIKSYEFFDRRFGGDEPVAAQKGEPPQPAPAVVVPVQPVPAIPPPSPALPQASNDDRLAEPPPRAIIVR